MLAMPARRFWMMERQIDRIRAENEIRQIGIHQLVTPPQSKEHLERITDHCGRLSLEIGEKMTIRRSAIVEPEPGASAKFLRLTGG